MMFYTPKVVKLLFIIVLPSAKLAGLLLIERNVENTLGPPQYF